MMSVFAIAALAAAVSQAPVDGKALAQPGRDPGLLHPDAQQIVRQKDEEQERALRKLLSLGGSDAEQAEILQRLAATLRARGLSLAIRAQAEADQGDPGADRDKADAQAARTEAISLYRQLLQRYPRAPRLDEALFFLADTLQDSGKDDEAVQAARELTRRFPKSQWAPASHVFIGEHLFDKSKLAQALAEYQAAARVETDEVYPYALYKAAWCRFNQSAFHDALELLTKVVGVSLGGEAANPVEQGEPSKVQLAREARRDFVIVFARVGKPEAAREEFARRFGRVPGLKMLELYGKLLFTEGRDPEAQLVHRQLLEIHGDRPAAALDQTRLLMIAARSGKRKDLLREAQALVETFQRVRRAPASPDEKEHVDEAQSHAEETLRTLAVATHNEARKTQLDDTLAATKALYTDYLTLFPDAKDAYEMRFFDAELLYGLGEKAKAAELYEAVAKQDLDAMRAGNKPGKWLTKAAWSAVVSRAEVAGDSQPRKDGHGTPQPASATSPQRAITADESKLADACLLYLDVLPDGPHAVEVAFKIGRLEYLAGKLDGAEKHLSWVAQKHPESDLAEYAANLVLDIANLRKDYRAVHEWALRFLADSRLTAHGTLRADLARVEEQSAYALAEGVTDDEGKARALLDFVEKHPGASLTDKAIFGAAAALSRAGKVDDALAARARLWKEIPGSPLVARALLASAADHGAVGDFGDAATLLEKYFAGYRREAEARKWRKTHPSPSRKPESAPLYDEAKAQSGLHDAAVLREARNELQKALQDRQAALAAWPKTADHDEQVQAAALLRAKLGEPSRAARDLAAIARAAHGKPGLQLTSWRDAARLFTRVREIDHSRWAWAELEKTYRTLPAKLRDKLPPEAVAAAAEAHLQLGSRTFDDFKKQQIEPPLMRTLNRKISLLQQVKRRAEETVAMRQADPAVCALAQLGEAQMLLAQSIAKSPAPRQLNQEERKLYRAALEEKAKPIYDEARETLKAADGKAQELGVSSPCVSRVSTLLEKLDVKPAPRTTLAVAQMPLAQAPSFVDAEGKPVDVDAGPGSPGGRER
ncbi:MAG: tetratricopeptide repeat protein [Myxococcales bacterium]